MIDGDDDEWWWSLPLLLTNILNVFSLFSDRIQRQTVKEELEINRKVVNQALDQVRQISKEGAELLSASEISNLQRSAENVKSRYDTCNVNADKLLRRIDTALEELQKFSVSIFFWRRANTYLLTSLAIHNHNNNNNNNNLLSHSLLPVPHNWSLHRCQTNDDDHHDDSYALYIMMACVKVTCDGCTALQYWQSA